MTNTLIKLFKIFLNRSFISALFKGVGAGTEHIKHLKVLSVNHVIDIGANKGQFALVSRSIYPNARIDSFEPLSEPADIYEKVFKNYTNVFLHRFAIGEKEEEKIIYVSNKEDSSSLLPIGDKQNFFFPGTHERSKRLIKVVLLEKLIKNMNDCKPQLMTAVPRFYQNLFQKINASFNKVTGLKKKLILKMLELGTKKINKQSLTILEKLIDNILEKIVRKKIKSQFGGELKTFVSGGGALDKEVGIFLNAIGLPTLQGYGLTETSPVVSCNPIDDIRVETVGPPFKGNEVKIALDGNEIGKLGIGEMERVSIEPGSHTARVTISNLLQAGIGGDAVAFNAEKGKAYYFIVDYDQGLFTGKWSITETSKNGFTKALN